MNFCEDRKMNGWTEETTRHFLHGTEGKLETKIEGQELTQPVSATLLLSGSDRSWFGTA